MLNYKATLICQLKAAKTFGGLDSLVEFTAGCTVNPGCLAKALYPEVQFVDSRQKPQHPVVLVSYAELLCRSHCLQIYAAFNVANGCSCASLC